MAQTTRVVYKLQLARFDYVKGWGGHNEPREQERGAFLQANGSDVVIRGYASAINRCGELNLEIKNAGKWEDGWRFVPREVTMENQESLDALLDTGSPHQMDIYDAL